MPNCVLCFNFGPTCMNTEICEECYFVTDDNGIRTKPNFTPKKKYKRFVSKWLTEEQVQAILKDNRSLAKVAKDYSVSTTCVWKIRKNAGVEV